MGIFCFAFSVMLIQAPRIASGKEQLLDRCGQNKWTERVDALLKKRLLRARPKLCSALSPLQLTLEQHGSNQCGSVFMQIFFNSK